jgi:hypothetical protein
MNRRKLLTIAGTLGAATLIACDMGDPAPKGGPEASHDPNEPPPPGKADRDFEFHGTLLREGKFSVWVEDRCWPVKVTIDATDETTGEHINVIDAPGGLGYEVKGPGLWTVPLAYPAGHHVTVSIKATAAQKSPRGYVAFVDGRNGRPETSGFGGTAAAHLGTHTNR